MKKTILFCLLLIQCITCNGAQKKGLSKIENYRNKAKEALENRDEAKNKRDSAILELRKIEQEPESENKQQRINKANREIKEEGKNFEKACEDHDKYYEKYYNEKTKNEKPNTPKKKNR